ncbi:uncharacterized protein RBU33_001886 [Hipposideros larvatus]
MENRSNVTVFILLGLSQNKDIEILCFVLFLLCYIAIWMGNLLIMISITCSPLIDQPMYFFLNYLSLTDLCYTSTVMPKLMTGLLEKRKTISYNNCMTQLVTLHFLGGIEIFILTGMAYDRYVAICKPLHYAIIMNKQKCNMIIIACCTGGFIHSASLCLLTIFLPFCGPNEIDHYFCDVYPLLKLACTDTYRIGLLVVVNSGLIALVIFVILMVSYFLIFYTIRAYPAESRTKALSTCSSHLTVVVLFFVPVFFIYIRPATTFPEDKVFALFYTIVAPLFNPVIYTLRNMEMKNALRKVWCQKPSLIGRNHENQSGEVTFILLGFSEYPDVQVPLFLVFLTIYTATVLGNLGMIMVIKINPRLHSPMYYFLSHLSCVDFCYSTVVTPKLLENLVVEDRTISFTGCIMQFFLACIFVVTETFLLAVMAYDRFVAVCNPLLYTVVMSQKLCSLLVGASYSWGIACSLTLTYFLLKLSFRGNNIINNFVCEHAAVVAVSCSDPYISQKIILVSATFNEISSLMIILTSYVFIFITVMKIPSTGGLHKAFSTCASHLTAITIFHGTILFLYCVPNSKSSWLMIKVASVFYTVVIPMLNPLIYSLRNKDVKETVRNLINTKLSCDKM